MNHIYLRISSEKRKADVINDDDVEALLLSPEGLHTLFIID